MATALSCEGRETARAARRARRQPGGVAAIAGRAAVRPGGADPIGASA